MHDHSRLLAPSLSTSLPRPPPPMKHLTAQQKHDILTHCESRRADQTECDVAALHGVTVDRATIWRWRSRWDRTPQSLEHAPTSGRPRTLTPAEISRHVRAPILAANRAHRAVSYTKLLPEVRRKTGKSIALRTLQQIGKEQLNATKRHTRKRTADERECTHTSESVGGCVCRVCGADACRQCLRLSVTRSPSCDANSNAAQRHTSCSSMRLQCASAKHQRTQSSCPASNPTSSRPRLPPTPADTT